jgi:hypothetical protein
MPPLLYLATVTWVEKGLAGRYEKQIEKICTGDMSRLFEGNVSLKDALYENVESFLDKRSGFEKKMKVVVTIWSKQGQILYPSGFNEDQTSLLGQNQSRLILAEDNFKILNEGLDIKVSVTLDPNSLPSYIILTLLLTLSIGIFYTMYLKGVEKAKLEYELNETKWAAMFEREEEYRTKLDSLSDERKEMENRLNEMKNKLAEVRLSEDGLVEEIVHLEKLIDENSMLQKSQNSEIETLKSLIEKSEGEKKARLKKRIKGNDATEKRFKTLYKNLAFNDRALEGFRDLEEDMKLKCEEIVYLLNSDPDKVIIKRKVFGKKNRETVFEVIFAYNGRLYFRKLKEGSIEVLAVGTKNTQERELEFLDKL